MLSLTDFIEAFYSTSRYVDDLFNINNPYFEQMVGQIYPTELQYLRRILLILNSVFGLEPVHNKWNSFFLDL